MECHGGLVSSLSWCLVIGGVAYLQHQRRCHTPYGRYATAQGGRGCPAPIAWFIQEVPSFVLPLLMLLTEEHSGPHHGRTLLICTFMMHYFHRSFIFSFLSRGRPVPLSIVLWAAAFCSLNGVLQGHALLHCSRYDNSWLTTARMVTGFLVFLVGMSINIHSDHILRSLRKPGETVYRIPHGGLFELVSGANFLGEIVEWFGFSVAVWTFPALAFALFTVCSIGPRAVHHHRDYQQRFADYPRSRKALIPFIL